MSVPKKAAAEEKLLAEFPPAGVEAWRKIVEADLKGAPFEKRMFTATHEGVMLKPLYRQEDVANLPHINSLPGFAPFVRGASPAGYLKQPWAISQEIVCASPSDFNHAARNSLSRGLNAINMVLDRASRNGHDPDWAKPEDVGRGGLSIATMGDLDKALEGVDFEKTSLFIRSGASAMPFAGLLAALAKKRSKSTQCLQGCIEMDPLGVLAHEGVLPQSLTGAYREMAALTGWAAENAPKLQTICVHSRSWHEAGGNAVQELAFTLATGVAYLWEMHKHGLDAEVVAPRMRFAVTVGTNFFMEIAKVRALRMLWAQVVKAVGGGEEAQKMSLHIRTSLWNKSVCDPYNNLLRSTVEAFAGVLGGCDSMQVGAFDEVVREPDDFSLRLARNTQLVLQQECQLDKVIDPAGGSWCIESLTAELANKAWVLFQEVQKLGGMAAAMHAGFPQKAVGATAEAKLQAVSARKESIVGVNQYANAAEKFLEKPAVDAKQFHQRRVQQVTSYRTSLEDGENDVVLERLSKIVNFSGAKLFEACVDAASSGATLGEVARAARMLDSASERATAVCLTRAAVPFEKLRLAMGREAAKGQKPRVFLMNMGSLKDYKARADFSRGFFAAGGYEVISPDGFATTDEAFAAFRKSGAEIAVICSTDDKYPALVPKLATDIKAEVPETLVVLAGYPKDQIEAHKESGVDEFIHVRADAAALLAKCHARLKISL